MRYRRRIMTLNIYNYVLHLMNDSQEWCTDRAEKLLYIMWYDFLALILSLSVNSLSSDIHILLVFFKVRTSPDRIGLAIFEVPKSPGDILTLNV